MPETPDRIAGRRAWIPLVLWIAVIFGLSSVPNLAPPKVGMPQTDKICHLGEYGVLGALFARARLRGRSGVRRTLAGAVLGAAVGALDETYQRGTPGREVSVFDAAADTVGAALGAWVGPRWIEPLAQRLLGSRRRDL